MFGLRKTAADSGEDFRFTKAGDPFTLPEPRPDLWHSASGAALAHEAAYFDPDRWDAEQIHRQPDSDKDPVAHGIGRLEGRNRAALVISDFHLGDGSAGGDDFLESHLAQDEEIGLYTGLFPPGESRAKLFVSTLTFACRRFAEELGAGTRFDLVLNGDVINFLELRGRGGTLVSDKHRPFFRALAAVGKQADVYWLRGNHDYVVPGGPWLGGEFYVNPTLQMLAEHGDFWDKENWPPGPRNKGSQLVIEGGAAFEVHSGVMKNGTIKYLMAGVDNIRPWSNDAIEGFLDRRRKISNVASFAALVTRLKYLGAADDSDAFRGALARRQLPAYTDWLMVQGHTHVPACVPGVYYNTGSWITTLVLQKRQERLVDAFPFVVVFRRPGGERMEEFYTIRSSDDQPPATAKLETPASVEVLRAEFGYSKLPKV